MSNGYDLGVAQLKRSVYMEYPCHVHLETYALCNARCNFCPYTKLDRKGIRMSTALLEKVIGDLCGIPQHVPFQLSPFKVNEPFLDTRLYDILAAVNRYLPNAQLTLNSNASPLTEQHLERLHGVANVGYLWVSVNAHTAELYEQEMHLPFERTMQRLKLLHEWKVAGRFAPRVVLSRVGDGSSNDTAFLRWVLTQWPAFEPRLFTRGSWLGQASVETGAVPDVGCQRWFELSITATGVVAHCCMDGKAEWPIGDVNHQHVLEVYNSPDYRRLRQTGVSRLQFAPCNTCTFL